MKTNSLINRTGSKFWPANLPGFAAMLLSCLLFASPVRAETIKGPSPLRISPSGHAFVRESGAPFFWLADTGWFLFGRLTLPEADFYLRTRRDQGFTVVQAMLLPEFEDEAAMTRTGVAPFREVSPQHLEPNPVYFDQVDAVLDRADELGFYVLLFAVWRDYWRPMPKHPERKPILTVENARNYGEYLARRYGNRPGILWGLGGDSMPTDDAQAAVMTALAEGLRTSARRQLITYHPGGRKSSSMAPFPKGMFDFNMCQSGHNLDEPLWDLIGTDYHATPAKPVVDGESLYENIARPLWRAKPETPKATDDEVRRAMYQGVFAGGFGATYGANSVFQFQRKGEPASWFTSLPWQEGLHLPGARQVRYLRNLMLSRTGPERVPAPELLVSDSHEGRDHTAALCAADRSYAMVFTGGGKSFTVDLSRLSGGKIRATWYNPRTGEPVPADVFPRGGEHTFTPPVADQPEDWVLVLDDTARSYPWPGTWLGNSHED